MGLSFGIQVDVVMKNHCANLKEISWSNLRIISKSAIVNAFRTRYRLNIYLCLIFDRVKKLAGAVLWNVGRHRNEEPLCQFIGNFMVQFVDY